VSDYAQRRVGGPINEPPPRFLLHIILATALADLLWWRALSVWCSAPKSEPSAGNAMIHSSWIGRRRRLKWLTYAPRQSAMKLDN